MKNFKVKDMNIYESLNEITKYIDDNLENKMDNQVLAKKMGVNIFTMQKIFSLIVGISLADYIRKRRLSCAGQDLYRYHLKVIDVAFRYQYNNVTSFSRAFKKFHGVSPSKVNLKTKLKNFPRVYFDKKIMMTKAIEYEIIELGNLELYGLGVATTNETISKDAPEFFMKMRSKYEDDYGKIKYGMVTYHNKCRKQCSQYYCLYDKKIDKFEKIVIPASKWLVFRVKNQNECDIQSLSHQFYADFLPSCKYNLREIFELEYYHDDVTDFLVPIY